MFLNQQGKLGLLQFCQLNISFQIYAPRLVHMTPEQVMESLGPRTRGHLEQGKGQQHFRDGFRKLLNQGQYGFDYNVDQILDFSLNGH